jgi:predicted KAP-like P-loop ATPase
MITKEEFEAMVNKVVAGEGLTNEEATSLIQSAAELDQRGAIAEQIVQFVLTAAESMYLETAEKVVKELQLRDKAKAKTILRSAEKAAANLLAVVQLYVAQVSLQMKSAVSDSDPSVLDDGDTA